MRKPTNTSGPTRHAVEIVLAIEPNAAAEWFHEQAGKARGAKRKVATRSIGLAIAGVLEHLPGIEMTAARAPLTMRSVDCEEEGGVARFEESAGERRPLAFKTAHLAPGVSFVEFFEFVEGEQSVAATPRADGELSPREPHARGGKRDPDAQSESLHVHQTAYRWHTPDRKAVRIELVDALPIDLGEEPAAASSADGQPPFMSVLCELRLSCDCGDSESTSDAGSDSGTDERTEAARLSAVRAVFAAARVLIDKQPAFPELTDACARAAGDATGREPVRAARVDLADARTPHQALIAIADNIARQWFGNERGVRESTEIEFVHQMRVALRRAKTLIKTFPSWVDDAWRTSVEPGLQWIGEMLGEARDLDVFVDSTLPALAAADADPSRWSGLIAAADARRLEARARLQRALRSRRYAQLSLAWLEWLTSQHFSSGPSKHAGRGLREYAAKRARRHFKRLTADPPLSSLDAAGRHARRIEAKRLRYTLEFFEPLVAPRRRRKIARQVSRIQSVLGDANDAAAALRFFDEEHLEVTDYQRGFARGWCEAAGRAAAREADRLIAKLPKPKIAREVAA